MGVIREQFPILSGTQCTRWDIVGLNWKFPNLLSIYEFFPSHDEISRLYSSEKRKFRHEYSRIARILITHNERVQMVETLLVYHTGQKVFILSPDLTKKRIPSQVRIEAHVVMDPETPSHIVHDEVSDDLWSLELNFINLSFDLYIYILNSDLRSLYFVNLIFDLPLSITSDRRASEAQTRASWLRRASICSSGLRVWWIRKIISVQPSVLCVI